MLHQNGHDLSVPKGTSIVKRNQSTWGEGGSVGEGVWERERKGEGGREGKKEREGDIRRQ